MAKLFANSEDPDHTVAYDLGLHWFRGFLD